MAILRDFENSDALDVIAAVRETYGEEYTPKFMYDERLLKKENFGDHLIFTIAQTEDGEFMGIIGLKVENYFLGATEVISFIVREKFRKMNIGFQLLEKCIGNADAKNISSTYCSVAMLNNFSQRIMAKLGFKPTGLWLNRKFLSDKLKCGKSYVNDKVSMLVMARNGNVKNAGVVYLPERYSDLALQCYSSFDVEVQISKTRVNLIDEKTNFTKSESEDVCNKNYYIYDSGKDFKDFVKEVSFLETELSSVSVIIDIKKQSAIAAIETIESAGFKFTGFIPLAGGHEYIIFHLCRCKVDYNEFVIYEQFENIKKSWLKNDERY